MAQVNLNVVLGMVNKLTPGLASAEQGLRSFKAQAKAAGDEFKDKWKEIASTSQIVGAGLLAGAGAAVFVGKSFYNAAVEVEGYRAKLQVAMKDSKKADEMLTWAKKFAAKTPFEMRGVVDATTRLQLYGLEAKHWLPLVGDMAGAMGRDVTDGVEAIADAVSGGGLERLKEFGISSSKLMAAGWSGNYKTAQDIESLKVALESVLKTQFGGGMEKMMNTAAGAASNFSDAIFQLRLAFGEALLPVVKQATIWLTGMASTISNMAQNHPILTRGVTYFAIALTGMLAVLGVIGTTVPGIVQAYNLLKIAMARASVQAVLASAKMLIAGAAAQASGAAAAIGSLGWAGFVAVLLAAAVALLLVVRACRMGAEAWKAYHDAADAEKRGKRQKDTYRQEGIILIEDVAQEMGLKGKWENGTLSREEQDRLNKAFQDRQRQASAARKSAGTAGGVRGDWYGPGTTAGATGGDDISTLEQQAAAVKAGLGAGTTAAPVKVDVASMPSDLTAGLEKAATTQDTAATKQLEAANKQLGAVTEQKTSQRQTLAQSMQQAIRPVLLGWFRQTSWVPRTDGRNSMGGRPGMAEETTLRPIYGYTSAQVSQVMAQRPGDYAQVLARARQGLTGAQQERQVAALVEQAKRPVTIPIYLDGKVIAENRSVVSMADERARLQQRATLNRGLYSATARP